MSLILARKELRLLARDMLSRFGLELGLRTTEFKIEVLKRLEDVIIPHPYSLLSDTLQRMIFYLCAIKSNTDSILIFEEPEAHAFPYYSKNFAETMALDQRGNQYFLSTHNPYLLLPLLEKAPKQDLAIFLTYFKDYQTRTKLLGSEELQEIIDMEVDVFANIDRYLPEQ